MKNLLFAVQIVITTATRFFPVTKNILDMLRSHLKYSSFSYDGFFVQKQKSKSHRNPIRVYSYKVNTERFACWRMISAILQPLHFKKKSKGENIDPQNIQEHYVH